MIYPIWKKYNIYIAKKYKKNIYRGVWTRWMRKKGNIDMKHDEPFTVFEHGKLWEYRY